MPAAPGRAAATAPSPAPRAAEAAAPVQEPGSGGLPVTILTGFLGAGKTTLLNHILSNQQGLKTAVLVNEFGEIGIDNDLIVTTGEDMVELSNGCICCSINGELLEAVYRILERPEPVDYLVVETTGLADPLPVAMTFLGSDLREQTRLDSIITLVDAENFGEDVLQGEVGRAQIVYSDMLLLNKCDLVPEERLQALEEQLRGIKTDARILRSVKGEVPLPLLLSVGLFESDKVVARQQQEAVRSAAETSAADHSACDHDHGHCLHDDHGHHDHGQEHSHHDHSHHDHAHHDHSHHDHGPADHLAIEGFTSLSFAADGPFALRKF
ncbi:MAG: CobW family GTP-binding protein, partial [Synechococcus sp.]